MADDGYCYHDLPLSASLLFLEGLLQRKAALPGEGRDQCTSRQRLEYYGISNIETGRDG